MKYSKLSFNKKLFVFTLLFFSINLYSQNKPKTEIINSGDLINKAIKLHDEGQYKQAEDLLLKISKNDTNYYWSLYELGLNYSVQEKYEKSIEIAKEGLNLSDNTDEVNYYILLANTYDDIDSTDKAISVYKEALEKYKFNQSLNYNYGVALYKKKFYAEAEKVLINSLIKNPFHSNSHFYLGCVNVAQGRLMPGVLCLSTALLMDANGDKGHRFLINLESAYNGELEKEIKTKDYPISETEYNSNFQEIETLIRSDFALNKKYKTKANLNYIVTKQSQLIFDQIKEINGAISFYTNFYVPLFKGIADNDYVEDFCYYILQSADDKNISNWVKKKESRIKKFAAYAINLLNEKRKFGFDYENEKKKKIFYQFDNSSNLESFGEIESANENMKTGEWTYVNNKGNIEAIGLFKNNKKIGEWKIYSNNNKIKKIINFTDDLLDGKYLTFNNFGETNLEMVFALDKKEGEKKQYFCKDHLRELSTYKNDIENGLGKTFFINMNLKEEYTFKDGKISGEARIYFPDGILEKEISMLDGEYNGNYTSYYHNKNIKSQGVYKNGYKTGIWKTYYRNGQIESEGKYTEEGKEIGVFKYYLANGKLESDEIYDKNGKKYGHSNYYTHEGNIYCTENFRNDKIEDVKYLDKSGKEIKKFEAKRGVLNFESYSEYGSLETIGSLKNGLREGLFKFYSNNSLLSEKNYKNGKLDGKANTYFPNGSIKIECEYKDNELDGYFTRYFENGKIEEEGWYKNGKSESFWLFYFQNGKLSSRVYYLNDDLNGIQEYFYPNGNKKIDLYYEYGIYTKIVQYDTLGKVFNTSELNGGTGTLTTLLPNGKFKQAESYILGELQDTLISYNINGKIIYNGVHDNGKRNGNVRWFNDDGKLYMEQEYEWGKEQGFRKTYEDGELVSIIEYNDGDIVNIGKYFYPGGKLETEINYENDNKQGYSTYYAPDGQVSYRTMYLDNQIVSYSYLDKNGSFVNEITLVNGSGNMVAYFKNGKKSIEIEIKNGKRNGVKTEYYPDGKIKEILNFSYGILNGESKEYYSNGKLKSEQFYVYDELEGPFKEYNKSGSLKRSGIYSSNEFHGNVSIYNALGALSKIRKYFYGTLVEEKTIQ